jgi:FKBP-type peptidyl-prolyl cis-trans isomerase FkpA
MNTKTIQTIFVAMLAVVMLASCSSGSFKKTKGGMLYKIINDGKGDKLKAGNFFEIQIGATTYKDNTKDTLLSDPAGISNQVVPMDSLSIPPDYFKIFSEMKSGDSLVIKQSADSIIKSSQGQAAPFLKKGGFITMSYKIVNIYTTKTAADSASAKLMVIAQQKDSVRRIEQTKIDDKLIQEYLAKNKITATKTALGTYVEVINPGTGAKPDSGKQVSVMYTGMNLAGVKFDSNIDTTFRHTDPYKFVIGQMGSIPGFEDGIKQIAKGGKARIFIPSSLGYGKQGSPPAIKPNENLMFEVQLADVTAAPKQQPMMPQAPQQAPPNDGGKQ